MKKNALLTFIFACIPGAGQMYYGYMKRGLSLISLFILTLMSGILIEPLAATAVIVWMYSFFDTYDLIRYLVAGEPKTDALLLPGNWDEIKAMLPQHNKLLGWGLIGFGIWALYDIIVADWLTTVLVRYLGYGMAYDIIRGIPNVVVGILLVFAGFKLLGMHPAQKSADPGDDPLPPYPNEHE